MTDFEAIFFDFDGVLIDSEPVHWACWAEVLVPYGVTLTWEFYRDHGIGIDDKLLLQMLADRADPPRDWHILWAQYPAKKELFRSRMSAAPPFPPALGALLKRLQDDYRMAVVSSSSCSEIEPLLEVAGLRAYFETIVGAESVKHHKPAPDPYLLAADRLQVRKALVLEDSDAGASSGQSAGFEVLRIQHPTEVPDRLLSRLGRD